MNWYLQSGNKGDVVLNTKICFFRNLRNVRFGCPNIQDIKKVESEVRTKLPSIGYSLKLLNFKNMDELNKKALFENGLINEELYKEQNSVKSLLINDEENISIILNSENHFEMQFFASGMEIDNLFNFAREVDCIFDKNFEIAKSKKYGYLTSSPINIGTGLNATIFLHLPGLNKTGNIRKISQIVNNFGLNFSGVYIFNSKIIGDIYQISNKQTLGISEENIIKNLKIIADKIIEQEREARKLLGKNKIQLEDELYRSYGIFENCRKISFYESLELLSDIKMGVDLGIIQELNDKKISKLYHYIKPANLQKVLGEVLEDYDINIKRAEYIKQIIRREN